MRTLLTKNYFFIQLVLSKIPSSLKDHCLGSDLLFIIFIITIIIIISIIIIFKEI